jgi:hypothetical protein
LAALTRKNERKFGMLAWIRHTLGKCWAAAICESAQCFAQLGGVLGQEGGATA